MSERLPSETMNTVLRALGRAGESGVHGKAMAVSGSRRESSKGRSVK